MTSLSAMFFSLVSTSCQANVIRNNKTAMCIPACVWEQSNLAIGQLKILCQLNNYVCIYTQSMGLGHCSNVLHNDTLQFHQGLHNLDFKSWIKSTVFYGWLAPNMCWNYTQDENPWAFTHLPHRTFLSPFAPTSFMWRHVTWRDVTLWSPYGG